MRQEEYRLTAKDGLKLFTQAWKPDKAATALAVIVHGLGEHSGRYGHVAEAFIKNGIYTYSYDQRGHGRSEGPRGHTPTYGHLMDDLRLALDHACRTAGGELPVSLYGHSMGALEVIYFGLNNGEGVNGFIATGLPLKLASTTKFKALLAKALNPVLPKLVMASGLEVAALSRDPGVVKAYAEDPLVHDRISIRLGMFLLEGAELALAGAGGWKQPLLVMHGGADRICDADAAERFADMTGGKTTFKKWDGFYHEIHNEPGKEEVIQTMADWMLARS